VGAYRDYRAQSSGDTAVYARIEARSLKIDKNASEVRKMKASSKRGQLAIFRHLTELTTSEPNKALFSAWLHWLSLASQHRRVKILAMVAVGFPFPAHTRKIDWAAGILQLSWFWVVPTPRNRRPKFGNCVAVVSPDDLHRTGFAECHYYA